MTGNIVQVILKFFILYELVLGFFLFVCLKKKKKKASPGEINGKKK